MKTIKRTLVFIMAIFLLQAGAAADSPYKNYTYEDNGKASQEPQAYYPSQIITGSLLSIGDFQDPQDIFVDSKGYVFISDTGNNRIVELDGNYRLVRIISGFTRNGKKDTFQSPSSVYVAADGRMYVADTQNSRIVELDHSGNFIGSFGAPAAKGMTVNFVFQPTKIAVDYAGRMYIISKNCNQGIIQYEKDGTFLGYFGALKTTASAYSLFWKSIATTAQKATMDLVVPTEYSSLSIDSKGFVYTTVSAVDASKLKTTLFIHKLNPMGVDVLKRNGCFDPMGDVEYGKDDNGLPDISRLCDICIENYGVYSVLDSNKKRVFTYDRNGNLLFVFGGAGSEKGLFGSPAAVDSTGQKILVLDNLYDQIVEFSPTKYAKLMLEAVGNDYNRQYAEASKSWMAMLKYTSKSNIVFDGIGDSYYNRGNYKNAMRYYRLAGDQKNYSAAFQYCRNDFLSRYFGWFLAVIAALILLHFVRKILKRKGAKR